MTKNGYSGLCSTCEGRATCTYRHYGDRPTLFCEEFDGLAANLTADAASAGRLTWGGEAGVYILAQEHRLEVRQKQSRYKGLCATCENQEACTFPKSVGGVWDCGEFA